MRNMKVTKQQIIDAINTSNSMAHASSKLPINFKTFRSYAIKLGVYNTNQSGIGIKRKRPKIPIQDILTGKQPQYHTYKLGKRLVEELNWKYVCSICGIFEWQNKFLSLELDHIDGNCNNHQENNLRFICPNCHSQTSTFRNKKRLH